MNNADFSFADLSFHDLTNANMKYTNLSAESLLKKLQETQKQVPETKKEIIQENNTTNTLKINGMDILLKNFLFFL